jgi:exonuclease III
MAGVTTYLSILTMNVNRLKSHIKSHLLAKWIKKEDSTICYLQETSLIDINKHWLRVKCWKNIYHTNTSPKTGRSNNTYIRQSRLQTYISQMRQRGSLHTDKRGNMWKGNNSYQPICTTCKCNQLHQMYTKWFKSMYILQHSGSERL